MKFCLQKYKQLLFFKLFVHFLAQKLFFLRFYHHNSSAFDSKKLLLHETEHVTSGLVIEKEF